MPIKSSQVTGKTNPMPVKSSLLVIKSNHMMIKSFNCLKKMTSPKIVLQKSTK